MKLSVIIPAYNEQQRIVPTLLDIQSYLKAQPYDYEVIVMVNGCTDGTFKAAAGVAELSANKIIVKDLPKPGKGNAVKRGVLDVASGDIILFMDSDNATSITEIEKFFGYFERGYNVVIGSRYLNTRLMEKPPAFYRVILSRMSNALIRLLAVPGITDTQLGFKAFDRKAALDIFPLLTIERWAFDIELLAIALARGYKIKEVPVVWREPGGSHVALGAYLGSLMDLFKIKWRSTLGKYNVRPEIFPENNWSRDHNP